MAGHHHYHHRRHHGQPLHILHRQGTHPTAHLAKLREHHSTAHHGASIWNSPPDPKAYAAVQWAAKEVGVSHELAGGIAHLESGVNPNAQNAQSKGLFQIQAERGHAMVKEHGPQMAKSLQSLPDHDRYAAIIPKLAAGKGLRKAEYDAFVMDANVNALLGVHSLNDSARGMGFAVNSTKDLTKIYSMHLTGRLVTPGTGPLTEIVEDWKTNSNRSVLGVAPEYHDRGKYPVLPPEAIPTRDVAIKALTRFTQNHLAEYRAGVKAVNAMAAATPEKAAPAVAAGLGDITVHPSPRSMAATMAKTDAFAAAPNPAPAVAAATAAASGHASPAVTAVDPISEAAKAQLRAAFARQAAAAP